jgi:hypothetical protein
VKVYGILQASVKGKKQWVLGVTEAFKVFLTVLVALCWGFQWDCTQFWKTWRNDMQWKQMEIFGEALEDGQLCMWLTLNFWSQCLHGVIKEVIDGNFTKERLDRLV